ncbi:MAG: tRNA (adenosine(37)-N6)-dimethylallyltransferase MiaA [Burkholderiaceae bacterium]|jgi:tRNA dimethylallyltransferase|nr:tRNA (adenosine(37)-N6)-dimethylallyltransferase MiaA [Burkholderiaceae bacterium]
MSIPLAVAIMGPTASGKTAVALDIARRIPSEIISVDSALVYRGMDIGTAKPSRSAQESVPHHLIDVIDPTNAYSAALFRENALRLVHEITARNRLPLLVGGTMMYFRALYDGLDALPPANSAIRARLDDECRVHGTPYLHKRLMNVDPVTAGRLKPTDTQRIQRALEVAELSGTPLSSLHTRKKNRLPFAFLKVALEPADRHLLHQRIADRFMSMLENDALVNEVRQLRVQYPLHPELPSMRCVGYRQVWQHLDGEYGRDTLYEKGIAATRQLAKRQLTWLRAMPDRVVINCLATDAATQVLERIRTWSG